MQKIHFIEFDTRKIYYITRCDTFAKYSNTRLTGIILAELLSL